MKHCRVSVLLLPLAAHAADTNALSALAPAYGEIPQTFWEQHGTLVLWWSGFVLMALAGWVMWKFLKARPAVIVPPETEAREALGKLRHRIEDGTVMSEISRILRRYIGAAFQFPPGELTTTEFSAVLATRKSIGADLAKLIADFLRECDERKFSTATATVPLGGLNRALKLIELAEQRRISMERAASAAGLGDPTAAVPRQTPAAQ